MGKPTALCALHTAYVGCNTAHVEVEVVPLLCVSSIQNDFPNICIAKFENSLLIGFDILHQDNTYSNNSKKILVNTFNTMFRYWYCPTQY